MLRSLQKRGHNPGIYNMMKQSCVAIAGRTIRFPLEKDLQVNAVKSLPSFTDGEWDFATHSLGLHPREPGRGFVILETGAFRGAFRERLGSVVSFSNIILDNNQIHMISIYHESSKKN